MAVTNGAMTSLPASQTMFLQSVEEPENNSINFRDSLKFFQEQLVINGSSFPSPSSTCRSGNETLKKNGPRFGREQNSDNNSRDLKDSDIFQEEIQSVRSCKISIPTVDTILESVRVLRAIQKSQKERGSNWNLDITSKSDIESDFNLASEWISVADINQDAKSENESNPNSNNESVSVDLVDTLKSKVTEMNGKMLDDIAYLATEKCAITNANFINNKHSFWPSNTLDENILDSKNLVTTAVEPLDENAKFREYSMNEENLKREKSLNSTGENRTENINSTEKQFDINATEETLQQNYTNTNVANDHSSNSVKSCETNVIYNSETCNTPDSLSKVCRDLLTYVNEKNSEDGNPKEVVQKEEDGMIGMLKIETYEDLDTQKDDFLLNVTIWKGECSPNDNNSRKLENNDSDSGVGTQRSASSLSPNVPNQMQKDSWSDSCSSQYASAECSPYHSLNNVFDSSIGLNTPALPRDEDEIAESPTHIPIDKWQEASEVPEGSITTSCIAEARVLASPVETECDKESENSALSENVTDLHVALCTPEIEGVEQDTEGSYCFVSNYTLESPLLNKIQELHIEINLLSETNDTLNKLPTVIEPVSETCETSNILSTTVEPVSETNTLKEPFIEVQAELASNDTWNKLQQGVNGNISDSDEKVTPDTHRNGTEAIQTSSNYFVEENTDDDDSCDINRLKKFTAASCDLPSIVATLYTIKESPAFQVLPAEDEKFEETLYILSEGAFCEHPEDNYLVTIEDSTLNITKDAQVLLSLNMKYGEVSVGMKNTLKIDNRMGRCVYIKCEFESLINLKTEIELHCLKHWQTDCLQLVHYPLKCHQNVVIIDLGSCSTRAGILMDQPTLPTIFFPTICATDKKTGTSVYGMEALQPEVRQHSNLSFPARPSVKITKHTIDIDLLEGLFKKIFMDLHVDPSDYTVQVCLPRNLSINTQNALVKLLLDDLKVKSVSLANQALLTLYAHDVSTAVVVNIGDRTEVLPVVDGFIVETGVTKLPYGGQRLIHHMKHGLAEKRISLSNDIDSFVVQYITENLAYVAEDYENEMRIASQYQDLIKKTITLQPALPEKIACKSISLEEARFNICEGLFNPELWGLDSPGIHQLVNKAIQATGVDVRKKIAENIYVSGGVTMLPGFVERLSKEVAKLCKAKIVPQVVASNYRYHCTYIGACKFAKMEVFPQVCITLEEYNKNGSSALKKCALCF